jgi:hypothetical protein
LKLEGIVFTRNEAPGALRNGTRVEKSDFRPTDAHQIGAKATVLGSLGPIEYEGIPQVFGYFLEWDDAPGIPAFVAGNRIRKVK